jgi:uncharacterized protein
MTPPPLPDDPARIALLDIVRGVALPGILLMNIEWFSRWPGELGSGFEPGIAGVDRLAAWLILVLVQGKFWLLFSLLFGAGFAVMEQRARAAGRPFVAPYLRRAAFLFVLGVAHAVFVWVGDILHTYAVAAVALLLFRNVEPLARGIAGVLLVLLPTLLIAASTATYLLMPGLGAEAAAPDPAFVEQAASASRVYATGDFAAITAQRIDDVLSNMSSELFMLPIALGVFLVGSWLLATGVLSRPGEHRRFHQVLAFGAMPVGIALSAWGATLATGIGPAPTDAEMLAQFLGWVGAPVLMLGYVGALALLSLRPGAGAWLREWIAPSGRMALTNYLIASLVCTSLFYGYGAGLWGQVPRAAQVGLVVAITVAQVVASRAWLRRFRMGPFEWTWRAATWLAWPRMRR